MAMMSHLAVSRLSPCRLLSEFAGDRSIGPARSVLPAKKALPCVTRAEHGRVPLRSSPLASGNAWLSSEPAREADRAVAARVAATSIAEADDEIIHHPPPHVAEDAHVKSLDEYQEMYRQSIHDPDKFWADMAKNFYWKKPFNPSPIVSFNFDVDKGPIFARWYDGGETNVCYNALDRHVAAGDGNKVAFFWEGNDAGADRTTTYGQLLHEVCRIANFLKSKGVGRGDRVTIYMPMLPELPAAMLACARIGAVHSVVFAGFSADALAGRIKDSKSKVVITSSAVRRGKNVIKLKDVVDKAIEKCHKDGMDVSTVLMYDNHSAMEKKDVHFVPGRDVWWEDAIKGQPLKCPVEWMGSEDELFMLYTSGSTGQPKGVVHTTGGYMVGAYTSFKYIFDHREGDVFWCTADCGWITGHSYLTYGPLLNGATQVVFEGVPTYPDAGRCWEIVDKYQVTQFYTAPTAVRTLMAKGDEWPAKFSLASLRLLGSVGEPINPEAWRWYHEKVGRGQCPIMDTWWQTETGSIMITPLPGATPLKPGSATFPFFGVEPVLVDEKGQEVQGVGTGDLCFKRSVPSMLRTVSGDHERFTATYFRTHKGYYFTGDAARRDKDGYFWIMGRVDDVINVSGHRIGTAEVESALTLHPDCAEAAVVGYDHPVKGQGIYAFVTLREGRPATEETRKGLILAVRENIGPFAAPDIIHWANTGLPKTRSGKIMRRILRKIANHEEETLGGLLPV
eukprot:jgi/Mesvir1/21340/Mv10023-RA.2